MCGAAFFEEPLLRYRNMPKSAQFLPGIGDVMADRGVDMNVRQCSACGLVQLDGEPVPYYREVIRAAACSPEMGAYRKRQFADLVSAYSLEGRKIVEIGCGRGEYLSILRRCGVEAFGVEASGEAVQSAEKDGLRVARGYAGDEGFRLDQAPFDAFFILSFLEHLPDIGAVLRGIRNNLTAAGLGLVEVPNFDMMLRNNLFSEFVSDHLFYFTKETLTTTLGLNGFEVVACTETWHDYIISAVVRSRSRQDVSRFSSRQDRVKHEIEAYLARFGPGRVVVWGAGHQALAVMALVDLGGKIRYVVDSAVFKQGRYTPATHIPIVSPDALRSDPVDAVIVMAGSYSDEVARIIRNTCAPGLDISILRDFGLEATQPTSAAVGDGARSTL